MSASSLSLSYALLVAMHPGRSPMSAWNLTIQQVRFLCSESRSMDWLPLSACGMRIEPSGTPQDQLRTETDKRYSAQDPSVANQSVAEEDEPVLSHRFTLTKPPARSLFSERPTSPARESMLDIVASAAGFGSRWRCTFS